MEIRDMLYSVIQRTNNLLRKINEGKHHGGNGINFEDILIASTKKEISLQSVESNHFSSAALQSNQGSQEWPIDYDFAKGIWQWLQQPVPYQPKTPAETQIVQNIQEMRKNLTVEEIAKCSSTVNTYLNGKPVQIPAYVLYAPEWVIIRMANGTFKPIDY